MDNLVVEMEGASVKSGCRYLLKDISWQVQAGEHWVVFGRNGCGKTTLLSLAAGFKPPTSGNVRVLGESYTAENILRLRQRIGWVSSSFFDRYYRNETPLEIVLAGLSGTFGLNMAITDSAIMAGKWLLEQLGLGERINHLYGAMSKGERQNVLIARALLANPDILILDEPCSGLDQIARARLFRLIQRIAQEFAVTILYVTHYIEEIGELFAHTLLLRRGRVYAKGMTTELLQDEVMSDFLETPVQFRERQQRTLVIHPAERRPEKNG